MDMDDFLGDMDIREQALHDLRTCKGFMLLYQDPEGEWRHHVCADATWELCLVVGLAHRRLQHKIDPLKQGG